jgi:hypothetical protein
MTETYKGALAEFLAAQKAAVKFTNPNFTNSAITKERARRLKAARDEFRKVADRVRTLSPKVDPEKAVADAFDSILAKDANSVAVASNEWAKVRAMLNSGRELGQIIDGADRRRLSAILDHTEELGIEAKDLQGVTAEVQTRILGRLAALGDEKAIAASQARDQAKYGTAWDKVVDEVIGGKLSVTTQSALFGVAPDEFRETLGVDDPESLDISQTVAHLDQLAPSLEGQS